MDPSSFLSDNDAPDTTEAGKFVELSLAWPMVSFNIRRAPLNDQEIDDFQEAFISVLKLARGDSAKVGRNKTFILMNVDGIVKATLSHKLRAGSFISTVREYVSDAIHATAIVVTNAFARGILLFIMAIQPLKSVHKIFSNEADARAWLEECRQKVQEGVPIEIDGDGATGEGDAVASK